MRGRPRRTRGTKRLAFRENSSMVRAVRLDDGADRWRATLLDDIPAGPRRERHESRRRIAHAPRAESATPIGRTRRREGKDDVDHSRAQGRAHQGLCAEGRRHGPRPRCRLRSSRSASPTSRSTSSRTRRTTIRARGLLKMVSQRRSLLDYLKARRRGAVSQPHRAPRHPPLRPAVGRPGHPPRPAAPLRRSRIGGAPSKRDPGVVPPALRHRPVDDHGQDRRGLHREGGEPPRRLAHGVVRAARPHAGKRRDFHVRHSTRRADLGGAQARPPRRAKMARQADGAVVATLRRHQPCSPPSSPPRSPSPASTSCR